MPVSSARSGRIDWQQPASCVFAGAPGDITAREYALHQHRAGTSLADIARSAGCTRATVRSAVERARSSEERHPLGQPLLPPPKLQEQFVPVWLVDDFLGTLPNAEVIRREWRRYSATALQARERVRELREREAARR